MQKFYKVKFKDKDKIDKFIEDMNKEKGVIKACKNQIGEYFSNDTYFSQQWALSKIQAEQAWNINSGNPNVILAILDSGVDLGYPESGNPLDPHPDLEDNLQNIDQVFGINIVDNEPPYDIYSHGTHVAGIAGAITNNGLGIAGIAGGGYAGNGVKILIIKVGNYEPTESYVSSGIYSAVNAGAKVINISSGFTDRENCSAQTTPESITEHSALLAAVNYAIANDVVIVAALGNNTGLIDECIGNYKKYYVYPASYSNVISVANTNESDYRSSSSNYSPKCDISAPGNNIISTIPRYLDASSPIGYGNKEGTSMSAPYVSGVAALIRSYAPVANWQMVRAILKQTTDPIDQLNPQFAGKLGSGRLNAYKALKLIQEVPSQPSGITLIYQNNHPIITWDVNSEADIQGYQIYIKYEFRNGSNPRFWTYSYEDHFITANNYIDYNWFTSGTDKAYYYVKAVDIKNNYSAKSSTVSCSGGLGKQIAIKDENLPDNYNVESYPNPFNPTTTLKYQIKESGFVRITMYDALGRNVFEVINENKEPGTYEVKFNGSNLASGVYFFTLRVNDFIKASKIILAK